MRTAARTNKMVIMMSRHMLKYSASHCASSRTARIGNAIRALLPPPATSRTSAAKSTTAALTRS